MTNVSLNLFAKELVKNFWSVGALMPSSGKLASELSKELLNKRRIPKKILEIGAGTGVVTKVLASKLEHDDLLDVVEINPLFIKTLRQLFESSGKRLHPGKISFQEIDIVDFVANHKYDLIVCALPFNNFKEEITKKIFDKMFQLLQVGGSLVFFEYWGVRFIKRKLPFKSIRNQSIAITHHIDQLSLKMKSKKQFVLLNCPPAIVYSMEKPVELSED